MIEDEDHQRFSSIYFSKNEIEYFIINNHFYKSLFKMSRNYQSPIYQGVFDKLAFNYYSRTLRIGNKYYIFTACYDADSFIHNNDLIMKTGFNEYLIVNSQGESVYSTWDKEKTNETISLILDEKPISVSKVKGGNFLIIKSIIETRGYIAGYATLETLLSNSFVMLIVITGLLLGSPIVLFLSMYSISGKYLSSLHQLSKNMEGFLIGQFPPPIINSGDEIEDLSKILFDMAVNINEQSQNIIKQEKENAQAMYKILATQIDPHFVSNTMNIINIMARHKRLKDIIAVNNALSRILRDRLRVGASVFATVDEEIQVLKQYMLIIGYRYSTRVKISYDISESVKQGSIPKNILQLLVENSLFHGLLKENDTISGNVSVMVYPIREEIVLEVSDDGKGIEPKILKRLLKNHFVYNNVKDSTTHVGLKNIYDRLKVTTQAETETKEGKYGIPASARRKVSKTCCPFFRDVEM